MRLTKSANWLNSISFIVQAYIFIPFLSKTLELYSNPALSPLDLVDVNHCCLQPLFLLVKDVKSIIESELLVRSPLFLDSQRVKRDNLIVFACVPSEGDFNVVLSDFGDCGIAPLLTCVQAIYVLSNIKDCPRFNHIN